MKELLRLEDIHTTKSEGTFRHLKIQKENVPVPECRSNRSVYSNSLIVRREGKENYSPCHTTTITPQKENTWEHKQMLIDANTHAPQKKNNLCQKRLKRRMNCAPFSLSMHKQVLRAQHGRRCKNLL